MYTHNLKLERIQRALVDGLATFASVLAAVAIRHSGWFSDMPAAQPWTSYLFPAAVVAALTVFVLQLAGSYREPDRGVSVRTVAEIVGSATVIMLAIGLFHRQDPFTWTTILFFVPVAVFIVTAARFVYGRYVRSVWRAHTAVRRLLIVGRTESGKQLATTLAGEPAYYDLVGFLDDSTEIATNGSRVDVVGRVSDLGRVIDEMGIDEVVICLPADADASIDAVGECMRRNVTWRLVPNMFGLRLDRVTFDSFGGVPLAGLHDAHHVGFSWLLKRGFDIVVSAIALVLVSPLLLILAIIVRATTRGPALFKQTRVGVNGRPFTMLKFRSMRSDSSVEIHNEYTRQWIHGQTGSATNGNGTAEVAVEAEIHKITDDPRVTPVGKFLRASSLDELPQFWNVLRGDMSIVGPRPALPYEVERYTEWHKRRLAVPPGITGAWQVSGRSDLSFEEMVALDVDYIEQWSIEKDFEVVFKTLPAILKFSGK